MNKVLKNIFKHDPFFYSERLFFKLEKKSKLEKYDLNVSIYDQKAQKRLRLLILLLTIQELVNRGKETRKKNSLKDWLISEKNSGRDIIAFEIDCAIPKNSCLLVSCSKKSVFNIYSDTEKILIKKMRTIKNKKTASAITCLKIELIDIKCYLVGKPFSVYGLI